MVAFDIHFTSQATGAEVEPNKPVDVKIEITDALAAGVPEEALGALTIAHIFDNGGAEIVSAPAEAPAEESVGEPEFSTDKFSTFTISWSQNWSNRSVTVHYGYLSNGTTGSFEEFDAQPAPTPYTNTNYRAHLVYDFTGYEYYQTRYTTQSGGAASNPLSATRIGPLLRYNYGWEYKDYTGDDWTGISNNSHIYVIYKAKAVTTGGTVNPSTDQTWPEGNDLPAFSKDSTSNGNGTNTIALSIAAGEKESTADTKANVIVVFDLSGSMRYSMDGGTGYGNASTRADRINTNARLSIAANAINNMADTLLGKNTSSKTIAKMALVTFSDTAQQVGGWYTTASSFKSAVNALTADGGTNWEQALSIANGIAVDSDAATFVVFMTDGDPTVRISRGNITDQDLNSQANSWDYRDVDDGTAYYVKDGIYGTGTHDNFGRNFSFAVNEVSAINGKNKSFYAVGISDSVTKVQNLVTSAGVDASHAFLATTASAVADKLGQIASSISTMLGFGGVEINDGVTSLSNMEMKVMTEVDPSSFTYYRYGGSYGGNAQNPIPWTSREADGCAPASYDKATGAVQWNMGDSFQLEDGVTYVVKFLVWASQDALNLVAELNNGTKQYATLSESEKNQIVEINNADGTKSYSLKTNTDEVSATYKKTSETGGTVTVADDSPIDATYNPGTLENLSLKASTIDFLKIWNNELDQRAANPLLDESGNPVLDEEGNPVLYIDLKVMREVNGSSEVFYDPLRLRSDMDWEYDDLFISCGVMVVDSSNNIKIRENGYDYTVEEPAGYSYYWDLSADTFHPMLINNVSTLLKKDEKPSGMTGDYYVSGGNTYYKIGENYYRTINEGENRLTAVNDRRSSLDLKKVVDGSAPEGTLFSYTVVVTYPEGNTTDNAVWFSVRDAEGVTRNDVVTSATPEISETTGEKTGYYYSSVDANLSTTFSLSLGAGWNVRFTNLPGGTTYSFIEGTTPGYDLTAIDYSLVSRGEAATDYSAEVVLEDNKIEGTVDRGNSTIYVEYTNKSEYIFVYHSSDNSIERIALTDSRLAGGSFNIACETKESFIYGGYYKAYSDASLSEKEIFEAQYTAKPSGNYTYTSSHPTEGDWVSDTSGIPYDGTKDSVWVGKDAYTEEIGLAITPVAGTVYYLKEVPDIYLTPATYVVYDTHDVTTKDGNDFMAVKKLYLITSMDDENYESYGFDVSVSKADKPTTELYRGKEITVQKADGTKETINVGTMLGNKTGRVVMQDACCMIKENAYYREIPYHTIP